jgi:hypothetical protein
MDTPVDRPAAVNHQATTTCTYKAPDPAQSVIIEYQAGATADSFVAAQQAFELKYGQTTALSGLGDQAYAATVPSGNRATYTVVTLVGSSQVVVVGGNSLTQVERLAGQVLSALYDASTRAQPTTTTVAPPGSSTSTTG